MTHSRTSHGASQEVNLTYAELTNLVKEAIISILLVQGLTKEALLSDIQTMIVKAIAEVVPKHDPEMDIFYNATLAGKFFGVSRQTIQSWKNKELLVFDGIGRHQVITKADCRKALKVVHLRPAALKKRIDSPEKLTKDKKKG